MRSFGKTSSGDVVVRRCGWKDDGELPKGMRPVGVQNSSCVRARTADEVVLSFLVKGISLTSASRKARRMRKAAYFARERRNFRHIPAESAERKRKRKSEGERDGNKNINYELPRGWLADSSAAFPFEKVQQTLAECALRMRAEEFVLYLTGSPGEELLSEAISGFAIPHRAVARVSFHSDG